MAEYLLLLHDDSSARYKQLSPTEMQAVMEKYAAWTRKLSASGHLLSGKKLTWDGGKHLRRRRGEMVMSDGPYAETKDVVGGFFLMQASDYAAIQALAADCPHLDYGWIEIRAIDAMVQPQR
jgi:hypothetical protein